jgi:hypothetical protein
LKISESVETISESGEWAKSLQIDSFGIVKWYSKRKSHS